MSVIHFSVREFMRSLSLPASIVVAAVIVGSCLVLVAVSQRYAFVGTGGEAVKLDRLTGETVVCVVQTRRREEGGRMMVAPCDGSMP